MLMDIICFISSNFILVIGCYLFVYVVVFVDRFFVKFKFRNCVIVWDMNDIFIINELRSKLLNVNDLGYKKI